MKMSEYVRSIEYAATETLRLVWSEHLLLEAMQARIVSFDARIEASAQRIEWLQANPEFDDDFQSTAMRFESYFGPEKERSEAANSRESLEQLIAVREFSTDAQSGNMLQYGKQGISMAHGSLNACPVGRKIGGQSIKEIIWQARNQGLHWEDGEFKKPVRACFDALARDVDPKFACYSSRNMAWDVVGLLGWKEFSDFERDMLLLS